MLPTRAGMLTFGVDVEFCSETKWSSCYVRGDSIQEVPRKGFERFLRLFARHEFVVQWKDVSEPRGPPGKARPIFSAGVGIISADKDDRMTGGRQSSHQLCSHAAFAMLRLDNECVWNDARKLGMRIIRETKKRDGCKSEEVAGDVVGTHGISNGHMYPGGRGNSRCCPSVSLE